MSEDNYSEQLAVILAESDLPQAKKEDILFRTIQALAPAAADTAARSAGGDFLKILMQLLIQFLPILLKLLAG